MLHIIEKMVLDRYYNAPVTFLSLDQHYLLQHPSSSRFGAVDIALPKQISTVVDNLSCLYFPHQTCLREVKLPSMLGS